MKTPDWKLERYLLGELEPEEMTRIEAEARSGGAVAARLEALRRSDREIHDRYPAAWMDRQIRARMTGGEVRGDRSPGGRWAGLLNRSLVPAGALGIILVALVVGPGVLNQDRGDGEGPLVPSTERIKGLDPELHLYRKTATGSERLPDGALAREHDLLLIRYQPAGRTYGAILSVDGRGAVTKHLPAAADAAVELPRESAVSLDFAYELDDAPHEERFFFVTSDTPFDLEPVVRAIRTQIPRPVGEEGAADSLELAPGLDQVIFTLKKDAGHE